MAETDAKRDEGNSVQGDVRSWMRPSRRVESLGRERERER